ncbi:MAG TPA: hypothetical protein VNY05_32905 [Candidatus Acidoferrales bacterium]|nr:hypothetical protein [Candidatus Acidoferrales bacterium]
MLFFILKLGLARVAQMYASEPVLAEYHLATQSARFAAWPVRVRQRAAGGLAEGLAELADGARGDQNRKLKKCFVESLECR